MSRTRQSMVSGTEGIWPPLFLLAVSIVMVWWSAQYGPEARLLPLIVSLAVSVLSLFDLASRFSGRLAQLVRVTLGADFNNREMKHDPEWRAELGQVAWMSGCVLLMLLIGILPGAPLFVFAYMWLQGRQHVSASLVAAVLVFAALGLVFEILLAYPLYRGLLLGSGVLG